MMRPDESIDWMFVSSFCEDDDSFEMDLPVILRDFVAHEAGNITKYSQYVYADDDFCVSGATDGIRIKFLNLLLAAARHGSSFSAEMICRLYKIYYKREYNQLKRFKTLSYEEVCAFDTGEELLATLASRIITVAAFMGIEVEDDCVLVLPEVTEVLDDESYGFKFTHEEYAFDEGAFAKAREEADALIGRIQSRRWIPEEAVYFDDARKFTKEVFAYHSVPSTFDISCAIYREPASREYAATIALLHKLWPNRTYTDPEIQLYRALYAKLSILVGQMSRLDEMVDYMIGRTDKFSYEMESCRYKPDVQKVARSVPGGRDERAKKDTGRPAAGSCQAMPSEAGLTAAGAPDLEMEKLYKEIEELRATIKAKDQTISHLGRMYREVSERERQDRLDEEKWEDDRAELATLREHLYSLTEDDVALHPVSTEEMEGALKDKRIVIVGGHDNWLHLLRERFPSWTYIRPGASNTIPENVVSHAEHIFFFTDTLSHRVYYKFVHAARMNRIPFGYIHVTNIEGTIRQIYEESMRM